MLEELSYIHNKRDIDKNNFCLYYTHIINGTEIEHATYRSSIRNEILTPQEQVGIINK